MRDIWSKIEAQAQDRVLILDGAMGTMIQQQNLSEADFRGEQFKYWPSTLEGNNDLLSLTQPEAVASVHKAFLEAGADMIETNSFNANAISQADYGMSGMAYEMARASAMIARKCADAWSERTPEKPRAVLGSIGPIKQTLLYDDTSEYHGARDTDFDEIKRAYSKQIRAFFDLVDGLLIETVYDTLNCKAAIAAAQSVFEERGEEKPILISSTITDRTGNTLSGQTPESFWLSVAHAKPFAVGLNCALGAEQMRPHIRALAKVADTHIMAFPNTRQLNVYDDYGQSPDDMARELSVWAQDGLLNIVGGCCGSTPDHIRALAQAVEAA